MHRIPKSKSAQSVKKKATSQCINAPTSKLPITLPEIKRQNIPCDYDNNIKASRHCSDPQLVCQDLSHDVFIPTGVPLCINEDKYNSSGAMLYAPPSTNRQNLLEIKRESLQPNFKLHHARNRKKRKPYFTGALYNQYQSKKQRCNTIEGELRGADAAAACISTQIDSIQRTLPFDLLFRHNYHLILQKQVRGCIYHFRKSSHDTNV